MHKANVNQETQRAKRIRLWILEEAHKKIIDLWSISFKLVDFTLRNCTRVQPYVFTTLSGLFSHQSLKIWLSNKISSIHSSKSVIFVLPVPFQSGFLLVHVWFKYVIVWLLLILFMNFFGNSLIDMN